MPTRARGGSGGPAAARPDSRCGGSSLARRGTPPVFFRMGVSWPRGLGATAASPLPDKARRGRDGRGEREAFSHWRRAPSPTSVHAAGHEKRTALTGRPCRIRWRAEPYRLAATLRSRRASWLVKPDSLSYQMMSLAMVPSRTWVDRASTTPPWVLPLKSMETRGSSQ